MIDEASISNYKSVLSQQFSLGRVNLFVGADGSGKTNILEALCMAAAAHDNALDANSLALRGIKTVKPSMIFHSSAKNRSNEIEVKWYEKNSWKKAKLKCDDTDEIYAPWKDVSWYEPDYVNKINNLIMFISDGSIEGTYPFADESKNETLNAAFRGSRNFRDFLIYNINMDALQNAENKNYKEPLGVSGEGICKLLSGLTEEQMQEINSYGYVSWTDNAPAPESLPVLFYMALFVGKRTPSTFAIDNIDSMLAPELCKSLIQTIVQLAEKYNKQVFITVCNPAILDGLNLPAPENKAFTVKMADDCQTIVEEVKDRTSA